MSTGQITQHEPAAPYPAPGLRGPRWRRMLPPALVGGTLLALTVALHLRDPHEAGSWGMCPTAALGFSCPGCGGLRAVNLLGNRDLTGAASSNLALIVAIPFVAYVLVRWAQGRWRGRSWELSRTASRVSAAVLIVGLTAFTVLRNLPAGSWLAP